MSLTNITWEEFETFDKVKSPVPYDFRTHDGKYYTFGEFGIASVRRVFEIEKSDFDEYLSGKRTAREVDFKAKNDRWPPTEEERKIAKKEFLTKHPSSLIIVPKNRELFTRKELEELIPVAEELWIKGEGKLPDDYVSPFKK
ncbi:TPA: hypothetical protein U1V35_001103 [Streptococcus suis]|nr:hypothetical protein [Streptococcus suis]HEM3973518.1 hypothetical protein [Streptococcus suis]HEM3976871.1 hypothetical protein [Streptococcus suis]HEO8616976.1 hypothetical protein [Streptococcus suis]